MDVAEKFADVPHTSIADVRFFDPPGKWDVILASPPCVVFSYARHRWKKYDPNSEETADALAIVNACRRIMRDHPEAVTILENPRGHLREELGPPRETVFYCRFGMPYKKPTDLWGRYPGTLGRGRCLHRVHRTHLAFPWQEKTMGARKKKPRTSAKKRGGRGTAYQVIVHTPEKRAMIPLQLSQAARAITLRAHPTETSRTEGSQ